MYLRGDTTLPNGTHPEISIKFTFNEKYNIHLINYLIIYLFSEKEKITIHLKNKKRNNKIFCFNFLIKIVHFHVFLPFFFFNYFYKILATLL